MSLMQLLTVGQSLSGVRDTGSYEVNRDVTVPRFPQPAPGVDSDSESRNPGLFDRPSADPDPSHVEIETGSFPVPPSTPKPSESPFSSASVKQRRWSLKQILFVRRSKSIVQGRAVQTEWGLEQVRVVRNDLNDSDLELVRSRKPKAVAPSAGRSWVFWARPTDFSERAWNRWAARMFGFRKPKA